eukprot:141999-Pelagomonas_calceolata.AAC.2
MKSLLLIIPCSPGDVLMHACFQVLLLCMRAPRSYTREDVVEFHVHGGGICASRVLQACLEAGARRAGPGEFTLRAFLNGRLDLSQVTRLMLRHWIPPHGLFFFVSPTSEET